jgi:hypothetical protein
MVFLIDRKKNHQMIEEVSQIKSAIEREKDIIVRNQQPKSEYKIISYFKTSLERTE